MAVSDPGGLELGQNLQAAQCRSYRYRVAGATYFPFRLFFFYFVYVSRSLSMSDWQQADSYSTNRFFGRYLFLWSGDLQSFTKVL